MPIYVRKLTKHDGEIVGEWGDYDHEHPFCLKCYEEGKDGTRETLDEIPIFRHELGPELMFICDSCGVEIK